jgi:predicted dehydrogenase
MSLSIGLVGCGRWGRMILRDLIALDARVYVAVPSEEGRQTAIEAGAAGLSPNIAGLPKDVDGYVVATPTATHAAVIEELVASGKPVFVEKPMTNDVAAARRLVERAGDRIFVMDKWRYHPGVEALAAAARSGELGEIIAIRSYRLGWSNPHKDVDAIWILLPHDLAIVYEILGYLPAVKAASTPIPGREAFDMFALLADAEDSVQVTIEIATSHPGAHRSVVVVGSKKSAQLTESYAPEIMLADGPPDAGAKLPYARKVGEEMPLKRELSAFLGFLEGGPPPRSSAAEGLLVVERIAEVRRLLGLENA